MGIKCLSTTGGLGVLHLSSWRSRSVQPGELPEAHRGVPSSLRTGGCSSSGAVWPAQPCGFPASTPHGGAWCSGALWSTAETWAQHWRFLASACQNTQPMIFPLENNLVTPDVWGNVLPTQSILVAPGRKSTSGRLKCSDLVTARSRSHPVLYFQNWMFLLSHIFQDPGSGQKLFCSHRTFEIT